MGVEPQKCHETRITPEDWGVGNSNNMQIATIIN